ncbi:MAG: MerR family DNA-binding protein [Xanthomonadales bacterium]|nr:MerR family DNA-binding protein [Xanthomonadales bacterium]
MLAPAGRLASGYRRYGSTELKRLRFVRRANALGVSLEDIRVPLGDEKHDAKVNRSAQRKLEDVDRRIAALLRVRHGRSALIGTCQVSRSACTCPILNALSKEDPS